MHFILILALADSKSVFFFFVNTFHKNGSAGRWNVVFFFYFPKKMGWLGDGKQTFIGMVSYEY